MQNRKGIFFFIFFKKISGPLIVTFIILANLLVSSLVLAIPSESQSKQNIFLSLNNIISPYIIAENHEKGNTFILSNLRETLDIQWSVTLDFNEPGNQYTYAIFGEAPDASDGNDSYDVPISPPPIPPYINAWFDTGLTPPYDKLLADYRFYPDTYKQWDLSIQWVPSDYVSPTDITISWNTNDVDDSEYNSVVLYDDENNPLKDMLSQSSYTYSSPALAPQTFYIICQVNAPPVIIDENPSNGATDVSIDLSQLSVTIEDPEGDIFNWNIITSPDIGSASGSGENNGTKSCSVSGLSYSTTYSWTVTATDPTGSGETTQKAFTFTTEDEPNYPPEFSNENPMDGAIGVSVGLVELSVYIDDFEDDSFDWSIITSPDIGSNNGYGEYDGTKTCSISGLNYDTTYTWTVTATDPTGSGETTQEVYTFTTEDDNNPPNTPSKPTGPIDLMVGEIGEFCTSTTDPDGDQVQYRFDWDDGTYSDWTGLVSSGTTVCLTYSWGLAGEYGVRAQARDENGGYSDWSNPLYVEVVGENDPPDMPVTPTGPIELKVGEEGTYTTNAADPNDDMVQYRFDWDDGTISDWTELVNSGQPASQFHTWAETGIYVVKAQARDENNAMSEWSESLIVEVIPGENQPPNTPIIDGPTTGTPGVKYTYTASATDPEGDKISYFWDWDDGSYTGWLGPFNSGESCETYHSWWSKSYILKVKAKDTNGLESNWGELKVTIPRINFYTNLLFQRLFGYFPNLLFIFRFLF